MKIVYRLYLTVTPAAIGALLMAGLFYWGQYAHAAPVVALLAGTLAVAASAVLAWANARFVARRIEHLASALAPDAAVGASDELDRIAAGVTRLGSDARAAETNRVADEREFERRVKEYAQMLATIAEQTAKRLEEVRLPLHILLENRFGDLNENQEEMLGSARAAAEAADADLVSLRQIAELDMGTSPLRHDRIRPSEIIDSLRPMLVASAESAGAALEIDVAPLLPPVFGDRARLQDALAAMLGDALRSTERDGRAHISVDQDSAGLRLYASGIGRAQPSIRSTAAARVIYAHRGAVDRNDGSLTIALPVDGGAAAITPRSSTAGRESTRRQ